MFEELSVLEVCDGTGFLTFHLLSRCTPKSLTVNDISAGELRAARDLVESNVRGADVTWVVGDVHTIVFHRNSTSLWATDSFTTFITCRRFVQVPLVTRRWRRVYLASRADSDGYYRGRSQIGCVPTGRNRTWAGQRYRACSAPGRAKPDRPLDVRAAKIETRSRACGIRVGKYLSVAPSRHRPGPKTTTALVGAEAAAVG
jgi:ubiquinone/menaquinone biosynthesis C-methylase UbiE